MSSHSREQSYLKSPVVVGMLSTSFMIKVRNTEGQKGEQRGIVKATISTSNLDMSVLTR